MTKVTIADVAASANLSTATVSKALRGLPVAPANRDRVLLAAQGLGWRPNPHASRLASGRAGAIGLVMAYSGLWYDVEVLSGVEAAAVASGYDLLVWTVQSLETRSAAVLPAAIQQRVDGLVFMDFVGSPRQRDAIASLGVPTVAVGGDLPGSASFLIDNQSASKMAVRHLIELGHTRIALMSGAAAPSGFTPVPAERRAGYRAAHEDAGILPDLHLEVDGGFTPDGAEAALTRLLDLTPPPTAIFCLSDDMALGTIAAAPTRGLGIPKDMSVIGFDDHPLSGPFGLTTIRQPIAAMAEAAVRHLIERVRGQRDEPTRHAFPVELVVRRSTAPPALGTVRRYV
jgi:DNA-binding LacI/PurR family transcriptional regulator